jgi:AmiR/NasT family two-component response regulator
MAHRRISETDAFSVLVNAGQNSNRKLRVVAADIVETGDVSQLPDL